MADPGFMQSYLRVVCPGPLRKGEHLAQQNQSFLVLFHITLLKVGLRTKHSSRETVLTSQSRRFYYTHTHLNE